MNRPVVLHKAPVVPAPSGPALGAGAALARHAGRVAVLVMVNFNRAHTTWAWSRLVLGGWGLRTVPGLCFAKVLGSGQGGGFGVKPSATHQGLFLGFEDEPEALQFVHHSPQLAAYRRHAQALAVVGLRASSSRGTWAGYVLQPTAQAPVCGAVAVLTRASIKALKARAFWRLSPAAEAALAAAPGCRVAMGLGEAPLLRQVTFSLWDSTAAMAAYARSGAHLQALQAAYGGRHFSESMFTRFVPLWGHGQWQGVDLAAWLGSSAEPGPQQPGALAQTTDAG